MTTVRISLLGGVDVRLVDGSEVRVASRKALALLTYLARRPGASHSRDKLAALLWGDVANERARHSLRQALATIRAGLAPAMTPVLGEHGDQVALDSVAADVDVARFERLLQDGSMEALDRGSALYRGELAEGLAVSEPAFEEWLVSERVRLRELAVDGLNRLLNLQMRAARVEGAIQTAVRLLALDPLQEPVHRTLMRLYATQGRRGAALRQYQACLAVIRKELGVEPEADTRALYLRLLQQPAAPAADGTAATAPRIDVVDAGRPAMPLAGGPLINRAVELEQLDAARRAARSGRGRLVIVSGEAGIGKSRLIEECVTRALHEGARVLVGRAWEGEQLPFGPWIDALRSAGSIADTCARVSLDEPWRTELTRLFPELGAVTSGPPTAESRTRLFETICVLLRALAAVSPLLIVLEDLHWADELSVRLLLFLRRRLAAEPITVLATLREEDLAQEPGHGLRTVLAEHDDRTVRLSLEGLTRFDTIALMQAVARAGSDLAALARLGERVWQTSGGNPFVIVETMRTLEDREVALTARLPLPRRVKELVGARLDRVSETARAVLAVAAVIGREFDFALLEAAAGRGARATAEAIEELVGRRILHVVGERLDFTHERIRHVAYERIVTTTRIVLHRAVAEALEAQRQDRLEEVADQIGDHYVRAGDIRRAMPYLVRFAELAARRYALDDALSALRQAADGVALLPPDARDRARLDVALREAFVMSTQGRQREVLELLARHADELARVDDATLAAEYHFRLALTRFYLGDHAHAHAAGEHALADAERGGDGVRIGKALYVLALNSYGLAAPKAGVAYARRAIPLLGRPDTRYWLGLVYFGLGLNCIIAGDLDAALDAAEHARAVGNGIPDPRLIAGAGYTAAWVHVLRGDGELAVETARQAIEASRDRTAESLASGALGLAYLEQGDAASAVPLLRRAVDQLASIPLRQGVVRHLIYLSEAYLLDGDVERARQTAREAATMGESSRNSYNAGLTGRALGRISFRAGERARAQAQLATALKAFTACEATFEMARTRCDLAEVLAARGDRDGAAEQLALASQVFGRAAAPRRVAAVSELACRLGLARPAAVEAAIDP